MRSRPEEEAEDSRPSKRTAAVTDRSLLDDRVHPPLLLEHTASAGRGLRAAESISAGATVLQAASASSIGLYPSACTELCSWCCSPAAVAVCHQCARVSFCSECTSKLDWHTKSGECQAMQALSSSADGPEAANAALFIRSILRCTQQPDQDDADCFWHLTGAEEELNSTQSTALHRALLLLAPVLGILSLTEQQARRGLCKIAQNAHDFGSGRALWPRVELMNHSCGPSAYITVTSTPGTGLTATVRALRPLQFGQPITITYRPLGGQLSSERQAELFAKYGWQCCCPPCHSKLGDTAFECGAQQSELVAFGDGLREAEAMVDADPASARSLVQLFARGAARLKLGSAHRLRLQLLSVERAIASSLAEADRAVDSARAWWAAVEPVQTLMDPADFVHELAALGMALQNKPAPTTQDLVEAAEALSKATGLALAALGEDDMLTRQLVAFTAASDHALESEIQIDEQDAD